jgi:hypothetical protein
VLLLSGAVLRLHRTVGTTGLQQRRGWRRGQFGLLIWPSPHVR